MSAVLPIQSDIHPIINGEWHVILHCVGVPQSGEAITMYCGITDTVEYQEDTGQLQDVPRCEDCQGQIYRARYPRSWLWHETRLARFFRSNQPGKRHDRDHHGLP